MADNMNESAHFLESGLREKVIETCLFATGCAASGVTVCMISRSCGPKSIRQATTSCWNPMVL